jgi:hypothetical protein
LTVEIVRGIPDSKGLFRKDFVKEKQTTSSDEDSLGSSPDNKLATSLREEEQKITCDESIIAPKPTPITITRMEAEPFMGYQKRKVETNKVANSFSLLPETPQFTHKKSSIKRKASGLMVRTKVIQIKEKFASDNDSEEEVKLRLQSINTMESPSHRIDCDNYYKSIPDSPSYSPSPDRVTTAFKIPKTKAKRPA